MYDQSLVIVIDGLASLFRHDQPIRKELCVRANVRGHHRDWGSEEVAS